VGSSLFDGLDEAEEESIALSQADRDRIRAPTARAAIDHISLAVGGNDWVTNLRDEDPETFRREILKLFLGELVRAGARHLQVIPMRDRAGVYQYSLVHASKSVKAVTTMKEAVSAGLKRSDLSSTMRDRIRRDLTLSQARVESMLVRRFGGTVVLWSGEDPGHVRQYLLESTPVFGFQCPDIKAELTSRGWLRRRPDRKEEVSIPPAIS
jgi:hypothetical protein